MNHEVLRGLFFCWIYGADQMENRDCRGFLHQRWFLPAGQNKWCFKMVIWSLLLEQTSKKKKHFLSPQYKTISILWEFAQFNEISWPKQIWIKRELLFRFGLQCPNPVTRLCIDRSLCAHKSETRNLHTQWGWRMAPHTGFKHGKLPAGLKRSCSRLSAVNLLHLSPMCDVRDITCFRHKRSCRSTMRSPEYRAYALCGNKERKMHQSCLPCSGPWLFLILSESGGLKRKHNTKTQHAGIGDVYSFENTSDKGQFRLKRVGIKRDHLLLEMLI